MQEYFYRRKSLFAKLPKKSVVALVAAKTIYRNKDSHYQFRQNSYFYYLTGIEDPDLILFMVNTNDQVQCILFADEQTRAEKIWHDQRISHQEARTIYGMDQVYPLCELIGKLVQLLKTSNCIWILPEHMDLVKSWLKYSNQNKITFSDVAPIIDDLRLIKSTAELDVLRRVGRISSEAHRELMRHCRPNQYEYELQGLFYQQCISNGCQALAYLPIIAGGSNATTLHYTRNNQVLRAGELLLIDAGGELNNYAADITRTIPISGKFSTAQAELYHVVLEAQLTGLKAIQPGVLWSSIQDKVVDTLVTGLIQLKILHGSKDEIISNKTYRSVYMHNSGHWLGLDVHDVGNYQDGKRKLEPGMVLTVEPGVYISKDLPQVRSEFLGIGIRIEDTVSVTATGYENFTDHIPKTIADIEKIMQK